jgi:hypothetical protein
MRLASALLSASLAVLPFAAHAQDAGVFEQWLNKDSLGCVKVEDVKAVSNVVTLLPEQFQFVRALYVSIPPFSNTLPPGDHAIMAEKDGFAMLGLVNGDEICARFQATAKIVRLLAQIEAETVKGGA